MGSLGKGSKDNTAQLARADELARQERIRQGTAQIDKTFNSQFTDDFFNSQQQNYLDYAYPQLDDQYKTAKEELAFSLARSGLLDSSVRADKEAELAKMYDTNKQGVLDKAKSYATDARNNVESARGDLITTLNATGDATGAANSAIARATALSQPAAYSALGQLFTDFTSTLSQGAAQAQSNAYSGVGSGGSTGTTIYSTPKNSTQVSR